MKTERDRLSWFHSFLQGQWLERNFQMLASPPLREMMAERGPSSQTGLGGSRREYSSNLREGWFVAPDLNVEGQGRPTRLLTVGDLFPRVPFISLCFKCCQCGIRPFLRGSLWKLEYLNWGTKGGVELIRILDLYQILFCRSDWVCWLTRSAFEINRSSFSVNHRFEICLKRSGFLDVWSFVQIELHRVESVFMPKTRAFSMWEGTLLFPLIYLWSLHHAWERCDAWTDHRNVCVKQIPIASGD